MTFGVEESTLVRHISSPLVHCVTLDGGGEKPQNSPLPWQSFNKKGKCSPYLSEECRVPELIPVIYSQPAGAVSHEPGGRPPLLSARPAVTPASLKKAATNFAAWWTEVRWMWTVCLWQRRDCALNPGPSAPESSTLTTRLPSHRELHAGDNYEAARGIAGRAAVRLGLASSLFYFISDAWTRAHLQSNEINAKSISFLFHFTFDVCCFAVEIVSYDGWTVLSLRDPSASQRR